MTIQQQLKEANVDSIFTNWLHSNYYKVATGGEFYRITDIHKQFKQSPEFADITLPKTTKSGFTHFRATRIIKEDELFKQHYRHNYKADSNGKAITGIDVLICVNKH